MSVSAYAIRADHLAIVFEQEGLREHFHDAQTALRILGFLGVFTV